MPFSRVAVRVLSVQGFQGFAVIDASAARRYARALLEAASEDKSNERVGQELDAAVSALQAPEATDLLVIPGLDSACFG